MRQLFGTYTFILSVIDPFIIPLPIILYSRQGIIKEQTSRTIIGLLIPGISTPQQHLDFPFLADCDKNDYESLKP